MKPRDLVEVHDELRRLLALGQPPAVAVLLCARFLEGTEDAAKGWWYGLGFRTALEMARRIPSVSFEGIPPEETARLERILRAAHARPIPPLPGEEEWQERCDSALSILRDALDPSSHAPDARQADDDEPVGIRVPVISALSTDGTDVHPLFADVGTASMVRIVVDADLVERGPEILVDGPVSPESRGAFEEAIAFLDRLPGSGPKRSLIRVRWRSEGRLTGRSATLPFLLAAAVARSRLSLGFASFRLDGGVAATGDLEGTRVRAVEPVSLAEKVRASYHGGVRVLLVPAEQESEARGEAARLAETSHGRSAMDVVGVHDPLDAWRDRRVVVRRWRSPRRIAAGWLYWMTRSRIRIALVASIVVLLAGLSIAASVVTRDIPTDVGWKGDDLLFRNRYGWITRRVPFPYEDKDPNPAIGPNALLLDVEGRRVALVIHGSAPGSVDRLAALDHHGHPIWERSSADVRGVTEGSLRWKAFVPLASATGRPEILAVRRSTQHGLTLIDRIDLRTGALLGELRNDGHLEWLAWVDPAKRGVRLPAILGTHNPSARGIVAFLDAGAMSASARIDSLGEIPRIAEPRSLACGVAAAWSFQKDRFTTQQRVACGQIADDDDDLTMASVSDGSGLAVNYYLRVPELRRPAVASVQIIDGYKAALARTHPELTPGMLEEEEARLARSVETLTPDGWKTVDFLQSARPTSLGR